jgi:hypothetical protein
LLLEDNLEDPESIKKELLHCYNDTACYAILASFVDENDKDEKSRCIYISRTVSDDPESASAEAEPIQSVLTVSWQPPPNAVGPMVMLLKKTTAPLSDLIPIARQVQVLSIAMKDRDEVNKDDSEGGEDDNGASAPVGKEHTSIGPVLSSLRGLLSGAFIPTLGLYKADLGAAGGLDDGGKTSDMIAPDGSQLQSLVQAKDLKNVWDKLKELDSLLEKYQKGVTIPEVVLSMLPEIEEAKVAWEKEKPPGSQISTASLKEHIEEDVWLTKLQDRVNDWAKDIGKLMKVVDADPEKDSSVQDEMRFWSDLGTALDNTRARLDSSEVVLTFACLREGKRMIPVERFEKDVQTNLGACVGRVKNVMRLMETFPIGMLLSAQNFKDINVSLESIFQHFCSKIKQINHHTNTHKREKYEQKRTENLYKMLSHDLCKVIDAAYGRRKLMRHSINDCCVIAKGVQSIFECWDKHTEKLRGDLREIFKPPGKPKNGQQKDVFTLEVCDTHDLLRKRVDALSDFLDEHTKFREVRTRVCVWERGDQASTFVIVRPRFVLVFARIAVVLKGGVILMSSSSLGGIYFAPSLSMFLDFTFSAVVWNGVALDLCDPPLPPPPSRPHPPPPPPAIPILGRH